MCTFYILSEQRNGPNLSELWDVVAMKNTAVKINNEVSSKSIHCYCKGKGKGKAVPLQA